MRAFLFISCTQVVRLVVIFVYRDRLQHIRASKGVEGLMGDGMEIMHHLHPVPPPNCLDGIGQSIEAVGNAATSN